MQIISYFPRKVKICELMRFILDSNTAKQIEWKEKKERNEKEKKSIIATTFLFAKSDQTFN